MKASVVFGRMTRAGCTCPVAAVGQQVSGAVTGTLFRAVLPRRTLVPSSLRGRGQRCRSSAAADCSDASRVLGFAAQPAAVFSRRPSLAASAQTATLS